MLCEKCKKNQATVFYEENINGNKRSYSLCGECAAALEKEGDISFGYGLSQDFFALPSFGSFHDGLFGGLFGQTVSHAPQKTCRGCGSSFDDFRKNGKTGCPECYVTFGEELNDTIRSIHGNIKHVGRAPASMRRNREKQDKLAKLKEQLRDAISGENFELAAKLRDEIHGLEENK